MYFLVVCLCWAACAAAAPASSDVVPLENQQPTVIPIVSQSEELEVNGTYKFSYETGNGIKREETSYDKIVPRARGQTADSNEGGESDSGSDEIHVQQGSYSYTAPDGTLISVRYIADENGFQPIGDHIPRVPTASFGSSAEKSGRALKAADNVEAGSTPVVASRSAASTEKKPAAPKTPEAPVEVKSAANADASTTAASVEGKVSTRAIGTPSKEETSTSVASTNAAAPAEASATESAISSETPAPAESSTREAALSEASEASSTPASEPSSADASTTEVASTTLA